MTEEELKLFKEVTKDIRRIQPLFDAEPKLKTLGVGTMRSQGTARLQKIKANLSKKKLQS